MKAHSNLEEIIQKSVETKGELEDMIKIDKSKMSAEERAAYDELIKKFAVETNEEPSIEKKAPQKSEKRKTQTFSMMMELKRKQIQRNLLHRQNRIQTMIFTKDCILL